MREERQEAAFSSGQDAAVRQVRHLEELVKIGLALSAEKNPHRLLEMIVSEARRFTRADGGTLYIKREDAPLIDFTILQNDSLGVRMGGEGETITWEPVSLILPDGSENHRNVSAHCTLTGEAVNIDDVYEAAGFDFQGTRDFDRRTGYRSRSMLVIPMRDHEDEVIGVLQLLNARDAANGAVTAFSRADEEAVTSLASLAAIAITKMRLIRGLENLLESFVQSIATAIDEKSPYTAGHIARVTGLTERLARALNRAGEERGEGPAIAAEELEALRLASWLHDVGKITTPEAVVDKSTKLETIFDRIELVRLRVEILKRDIEIEHLRQARAAASPAADAAGEAVLREKQKELADTLAFLEEVNQGGEFLSDAALARLKDVAGRELAVADRRIPLLSAEELDNLAIRRGTLTAEERDIINNHARMTIRMLESLPYPKKLRNVPRYAGLHHERLDGSGYPLGAAAETIPLPARILAVADVFEALTAADRPYKRGKCLSECMRILGFMVKDRHLDGDICDLLVESGLAQDYAREMLAEGQRDAFEWKGRRYVP